MKYSLPLFFLLLSLCCQAQPIRLAGQVLAKESGSGLPYVNIGILEKNIGTASDEQGRFALDLPREHQQETLTFSAVGYEELSVPVAELRSMQPLVIKLQEKEMQLQEVVVRSRKLRVRRLGVTGRLSVVWGQPEQKEGHDIYEFANFINVKGRETELLSAHFYLTSSKLDSALFRINLYKDRGGFPGERLVEKSIVQRLSAKEGWVSINLESFSVYTDDNFFLGIEYLPAANTDKFAVTLGGTLGGTS